MTAMHCAHHCHIGQHHCSHTALRASACNMLSVRQPDAEMSCRSDGIKGQGASPCSRSWRRRCRCMPHWSPGISERTCWRRRAAGIAPPTRGTANRSRTAQDREQRTPQFRNVSATANLSCGYQDGHAGRDLSHGSGVCTIRVHSSTISMWQRRCYACGSLCGVNAAASPGRAS